MEELNVPLLDSSAAASAVLPVSRNVYVTYIMLFFWGLADSVWSGAVLSAWIFLLAGGDPNANESYYHFTVYASALLGLKLSFHTVYNKQDKNHANTVVGAVEALQGLAGLVTALPVGFLADKIGRAPVCRIGGVGFILAAALTIVAVIGDWKEQEEITILGASLILWGVCGGVFSGPSQALFADSVPKGQRSYYYTILQFCYMAPNVVGPILAIILFQKYGDTWTFDELRLPFIVGVALEIPAALFTFFLDDNLALPEEDEIHDNLSTEEEANREDSHGAKRMKQSYNFLGLVKLRRRSIPFILFFSDLFFSLGSGMTIKFFPLFFMKDIGLSPSQVQTVYIVVTLVLLAFSYGAQKLSLLLGRVQVVILARVVGISLLLIITELVKRGNKTWYVIIPLYLVRTAVMNCVYPLDESILMDNVDKSERSRWKALESVSAFGWCGSAFVGGYLADKYGYGFSFLITALFQSFGSITYGLLVPLVLDEAASTQTNTSSEEEHLTRRASLLVAARGEAIAGNPRINVDIVEEELIRELQQSP